MKSRFLFLLLLFSISLSLSAQKKRNFHEAWIETTNQKQSYAGYLSEIRDTSVLLVTDIDYHTLKATKIQEVPVSDIEYIYFEGTKKWVGGALIGGTGGLIIGGIIGVASRGEDEFDENPLLAIILFPIYILTRGAAAAGGALIGGVIGGSLGGIIQYSITQSKTYIIGRNHYNLKRHKAELQKKLLVF